MSRLPWMKQEADPSEVILIEWWDLNKFSQVLCSRFQILGIVGRFLATTRELQETGFFSQICDCNQVSRKNPVSGHHPWAPRNGFFSQICDCNQVSRKNPVSGYHPWAPRNGFFSQICDCNQVSRKNPVSGHLSTVNNQQKKDAASPSRAATSVKHFIVSQKF